MTKSNEITQQHTKRDKYKTLQSIKVPNYYSVGYTRGHETHGRNDISHNLYALVLKRFEDKVRRVLFFG